MLFVWIFLIKYFFLQRNLRKTMKKTKKQQQQFYVKILARFWLMLIFFSMFSLFSKNILLICSNITMLYITVPEIQSII